MLVWLAFLEYILVWAGALVSTLVYAHAILGIVVFAIAYSNSLRLRRTECPVRIKRIVKATVGLAAFEGLLGIMLFAGVKEMLPELVKGAVEFLHLGTALAIVTQAASTATTFDMWEEKEFS